MADTTDKITDVRNGARPTSARVTEAREAAGVVLHCNNLTGWPIDSKVHFVTYQIDTNNDPIEGTQLDGSGIVSDNDITQVDIIDGIDGGNAIGDVVEMLPTAAWGQDLADALTLEHDRTGAHSASAIAAIGSVLYPVGSIYTNAAVSTNPATLLGFGTWVAFGAGRVPVGVDGSDSDFDTVGETGGSKFLQSHTHGTGTLQLLANVGNVANGMPNLDDFPGSAGPISASNVAVGHSWSGSLATTGAGNSQNLQPYITVYMWKRTV